MNTRASVLFLVLWLCALRVSALNTNPDDFERVLVPIFFAGERAGANGALWASELWVRNESSSPILLFDSSQACYFGPCFTPPPVPLSARQTIRFVPNFFSDEERNPSLILYAEKGAGEHLLFSNRTADVSRRPIETGAKLPVMRESDLSDQPLNFVDVSLEPGSRTLLRLYDLVFEDGHSAYVDVYDFNTDRLLTQIHILFSYASPALGGPFSAAPGYAQIPLGTDLGALRVRVVVRSDPSGRGQSGTAVTKQWALITTTSNADNSIVVTVPQ